MLDTPSPVTTASVKLVIEPEHAAVLLAYAASRTNAEGWRHYLDIEHIINTLALQGRSGEADALRDAYNLIGPFAKLRHQRDHDAVHAFSIPNYCPEGNKLRDDYDARMAAEYPRLVAFDWAVKRAGGDLTRLLQLTKQIAPASYQNDVSDARAA